MRPLTPAAREAVTDSAILATSGDTRSAVGLIVDLLSATSAEQATQVRAWIQPRRDAIQAELDGLTAATAARRAVLQAERTRLATIFTEVEE